ncbi:MAG: hypothetical protein PHY45_08310 [Rhodocyclaceae bacterium]|nr:hypothetical protein [Rhodocyclaceae bacterium]
MKSKLALTAVLASLAAGFPVASMADNHWRGEHGDRRDMGRFHERDVHHWATGHWYHGGHDGRVGWWWVVGGAVETALWYSYAAPVYPYPDPYVPAPMIEAPQPEAPPVAVQPAPPAVWYFCRASGKYYPYVATCPEGWEPVPATPGN